MHARRVQKCLHALFALVFLLSFLPTPPVLAGAVAPPPPHTPQDIRTGFDPLTGNLTFVGVDAGESLLPDRAGALAASPQARGDQVIARYAGQFGLSDPRRELRLEKTRRGEDGATLRYRQQYQGIPVLGGELIINSDEQGNLLSLNGKVSPHLALPSIQPKVSAEQARQVAAAGMQAWHRLSADQLSASEPELWIYDPHILDSSQKNAPALVWRMEVRAPDLLPVNELVLVDAQSGTVALHFNQVGASWSGQDDPPTPEPTVEPTQKQAEELTVEPTLEPTSEPTQEPTIELIEEPTSEETPFSTEGPAETGESAQTWYVATTGSDASDCLTAMTPCATLQAAVDKAASEDVVNVAAGTYTSTGALVVAINKNITLNGGWNAEFTARAGFSTIDGESARTAVKITQNVTAIIQGFAVTGSNNSMDGGAVTARGGSNLTMDQCSVYSNGDTGIYFLGSNLSLINTTVAGNQELGVYTNGATTVSLQNVTIAQNKGVGFIYQGAAAGVVSMQNTLIAQNKNDWDYGPDCQTGETVIQSGGYNLIGKKEACRISLLSSDRINVDAKLRPLAVEGYVPFIPTSPAIDGGNPLTPGSTTKACKAKDMFGANRPIDGDKNGKAVCDIGAYETTPPPAAVPTTVEVYHVPKTMVVGSTCDNNIDLQVKDQFGLRMHGVKVTLTTPESGPSAIFKDSPTPHTLVEYTENGSVSARLIANDQAGQYVLQINVAGYSQPITYPIENYAPTSNTLDFPLFYATDTLYEPYVGRQQYAGTSKSFAQPLVAQVFDQHGRPMSGATVTFTLLGNGPSAVFEDGAATAEAVSDPNGLAVSPFLVANNIPGSYTATASTGGVAELLSYSLTNLNLYVRPDGTDSPNTCQSPSAPCATLQYALSQAPFGVAILLAGGEYNLTGGLALSKDFVDISGGWNEDFSAQTERTTLTNGVYVTARRAALSNVIIRGGTTGIDNSGGITVSNVSISGVQTGIVNKSRNFMLANSTISSNASPGIINEGKLWIQSVTLTGKGDYGVWTVGLAARTSIMATIISGFSYDCGAEGGASIASLGHNLFYRPDGCRTRDSGSWRPHTSDRFGVDPQLSPLISGTHFALLAGSPAIDAFDGPCPKTDVRGVARPAGERCDIGSFEYTPPGPAVELMYLSGSKQSAAIDDPFMAPLQVIAVDARGSVVDGETVTFDAPGSGAGALFSNHTHTISVPTGANGVAKASTWANGIAGSYTVVARVEGLPNVLFSLTNQGGLLYVDGASGSDTLLGGEANPCQDPAAPCKTPTRALQAATSGNTIRLTSSSYPVVLQRTIDYHLSGGWNSTFTEQTGQSTLVPASQYPYPIRVESEFVTLDHIDIDGGREGILNNNGNVVFRNGSIRNTWKGIENRTGAMLVENATLRQNRAEGVRNSSGTITLNHVTIVGQYYSSGFVSLSDSTGISNVDGVVRLENSILVRNFSDRDHDCVGSIVSLGHNLIGIGDGCHIHPAAGDRIGTAEKPLDPLLAEPRLDGGALVYPLLIGSPAIDAAGEDSCPATDQRGVERPAGAGCDIGAYEGAVDDLPAMDVLTRHDNAFCLTPDTICTGGADPDLDSAHRYVIGVWQFFWNELRRDGFDNAGAPAFSTVDYLPNGELTFPNAFWNGRAFYFGMGMPLADDVVAHEFAHAVTQYESNLFYTYQSGSISESLSDLWAEYYDQMNGAGNDAPGARWLIGEDSIIAASRSMRNPPQFLQPDRMSSSFYLRGWGDNGGVHTNSGINNKAVYLMVDGGSFNGRTVSAIGWKKTAAIYDYAQTRLLTSGSDYNNLYNALAQACLAQVGGPAGITSADCEQVRLATLAVEMNRSPVTDFNPDAPDCPSGMTRNPVSLYFEDFEMGDGDWDYDANVGEIHWSLEPDRWGQYYAASGRRALFATDNVLFEDLSIPSDSFAVMAQGVAIPSIDTPMLRFKHAFLLDYGTVSGVKYYTDGGVLEYSTNGGSTWKDAKGWFSAGKNYPGVISVPSGYSPNPLNGRSAFVANSHGYVSSRYNLSSLKGKTVKFRWRLGTSYPPDQAMGWFIDDVEVYTCVAIPATPGLVSPISGGLVIPGAWPRLDWGNVASAQRYELQIARDKAFTGVVLENLNISASELIPTGSVPAKNVTYYWRVRGVNSIGVTGPWSAVRNFRVRLDAPTLGEPANNESIDNLRPTFTWSESPGATSYTFAVSTLPSVGSPFLTVAVSGTSYRPTRNLPIGKTLYWRVRANGSNPSLWSATSHFTTPRPPTSPALTYPARNALLTRYTLTLKWQASSVPSGALPLATYQLQLDDDAGFSSPLYDESFGPSVTTFTLPAELTPNTRYYWRVRALNANGEYASWSASYFRAAMLPPALLLPAGGDTVDTNRPAFSWEPVEGATSYQLVISASSNLSMPILTVKVAGTSFTSTQALPLRKNLYWSVRALGPNGPSLRAEIRRFMVVY